VALLETAYPDWPTVGVDDFSAGDLRAVGDVPVHDVDIRDRDAIADGLAGADAVVHLAAVSGVEECRADPDRANEVNVTGTNDVPWCTTPELRPATTSTSTM